METSARQAGGKDQCVFRRDGEYWTILYEGAGCRLRDSIGLRHLAELLGRPGERISALDLQRIAQGGPTPTGMPYGGASLEQARVNVTRALRSALRRIGTHHRALGEHLERTLRTGASCVYAPDPRAPLRWSVNPRAEASFEEAE